jgi:hypothetical protein
MTSNCSDAARSGAALLPARQPGAAVRVMKTAVLGARTGAAGLCSDTADDRCYPDHISGHARRQLALFARERCHGCTVAEECLELALRIEAQTGASHGIWGGTAPGERRALLRERAKAASRPVARLAVAQ